MKKLLLVLTLLGVEQFTTAMVIQPMANCEAVCARNYPPVYKNVGNGLAMQTNSKYSSCFSACETEE